MDLGVLVALIETPAGIAISGGIIMPMDLTCNFPPQKKGGILLNP
jgi:hypothetical protein